ncbi:MAG: DegV family protein [Lachnospiraceae bacterium]|nr:DegV family protein [Lachnospiraceae bacterium]
MKYKIIGDSCCDMTSDMLSKEYYESVPLKLYIDGEEIIDDETFEQAPFLEKLEKSVECPKSSCPSPEEYMKSYEGAENVFVVTLSSKLSGSYNSAVLAGQLYNETNPGVKIHVFDSKTAAAGQYLTCEFIENLMNKGLEFEEIVEKTTDYINNQQTVFVLEDLEVMRKNGRLTKLKAVVANVLNIKPVLYGVDGEIHQLDQARGMNKALNRLLAYIDQGKFDTNRKVVITQCDSRERCLNIKKVMEEKIGFKDIKIVDAGGISSMYESRGGVIVSF